MARIDFNGKSGEQLFRALVTLLLLCITTIATLVYARTNEIASDLAKLEDVPTRVELNIRDIEQNRVSISQLQRSVYGVEIE